MIIFEKIKWKNFLSYGNTWTEIDLITDHTTIMLGDSGSGKSTLLDALKFVCYNKPYRNITKPQIVNSVNGKDCVVELKLRLGENNYKIIRGIKPNIFEIYKNGKMVNQDANVRDYQAWFEKNILGFNSKSFDQIVVLGAANFTPFMQLRPQDRRVIIEELLDIEIFGVMNMLLKDKMSLGREELLQIENSILLLAEKKKLHEKYIEELVKNKEKKIVELSEKIDANEKKASSTLDIVDTLKTQLVFQEEKLKDKTVIDDQYKRLEEFEHKINTKMRNLHKEIEFYECNDNCPTCKQPINVDFKVSEVQEKNKILSSLEDGMKQIHGKVDGLNDRLRDITKVEKEIDTIQNEINSQQNSIRAIEKYLLDLEKELRVLRKPKKNIMDERANLATMVTEISTLKDDRQELIQIKALHETASLLLKDTGVKARIIKQYLPLINKYTNKFLSSMNFFASFYINENFQEEIKSRGRDDFSYGNFSEGEKQRIDLALLFTWRTIAKMKNSVNTNLLVMDEIFDSYLDLEATENVIELLNSKLFQDTNIFVISHKNIISDKFDKRLDFKKVKNFSRIGE